GTGKTWTAIYSAKQLYECHPCLIVIAAPYKHLIKQWEEDVVKVFPDAKIILVSSENPQWENEIANNIIIQQYKPSHQIIIITTIPSFNLDRFEKILDKSKQEKLLIVDEAHRFNKRTQKTKDRFNYMLGLSATPVNWKNIEEGKELVEYFGGQVYTLTIDKALEKGFLVQYYYYPLFVHATKNEEVAFTNLTRQIMGCFSPNGQVIDKERLMKLTRARLRVIAMAEEKQLNIGQLLDAVKDKDYFIVYCGDGKVDDDEDGSIKHYDFVKKHLDEANIRTSQFTATESMAKRMELIDMFNNNEISSLVAIRCLDEGINIPSIRSALILASKDDYREFVQRRGRILRKYPGKKFANIYDVIVLPSADMSNFAKIELRRFYEYARLAINKEEMLLKLNDLLSFYNLSLEEDIILYTETEMEDFLDE
ncbi:MAG TPA: DEAD/DEAH box helicase family protein, partial [Gallicola sp.]|nr:DEAD/DEAH box helicase family protein [Gallicola sp.]